MNGIGTFVSIHFAHAQKVSIDTDQSIPAGVSLLLLPQCGILDNKRYKQKETK